MLKIKKILTFFFLLLFFKTEAQYTFQKTFGHSNVNVADGGRDCLVDSLGNIYITAGQGSNGGAMVIKTDSTGNIIWKNFYGPINGGLQKCIFDLNGNLLILGSYTSNSFDTLLHLSLLKIDTAGNII